MLCIAELSREKERGFFKKQAAEKLVFVSKVCYPFWVAPFRGLTVLLDGLNVSSHATTYSAMPDLKGFKENLAGRSATRQLYANFLSNNLNYFQSSGDEQTLVIEGFMEDKEFETEFMEYLKEASATNSPIVDSVLVSPTYDETGVMSMLQKVENTRSKLEEEVTELNEIVKLLNLKNQQFLASLRDEISQIGEKFKVQIQKAKLSVDDKISGINKEYTDKVTEVSNRFEKEITDLQKEVLKLEKTRDQTNAEIEHAEAEIKTAAINKDDSAEQSWKEKRNELKRELSEINVRIKELEGSIQELEEKKKGELFQLKQKNDDDIKEASKELIEVEASRDAEISLCQKEMEKLEELTLSIIQKIDQMVKEREAVLFEFDDIGIKQQRELPLLAYFPFYLFCYQSKSSKRFTYVAPSIISNGGLGVRLKAVGKTKISQIFQPRSRRIVSILNSFIGLLEENVVFNREIYEACSKINLLANKDVGDVFKSGLAELKAQGWLSDREVESFYQAVLQFVR